MTLDEKNQISHAIGEYFLRVVKNHNYYLSFKDTFFKVQNIKPIKKFNIKKENAYLSSISKFADNAEKEYNSHRHGESIYEYITIFINMVLRHYLEQGGVHPRKLGLLGQELFDLSCYCIFGDKYLEDMAKIQQATGVRAARNEKEAWLMAEYEARRRQGENLDFEEFMKSRTTIPDDEFWSRHLEMGQLHPMNDDALDDVFDGYDDNDDEYEEEFEEGN